METKKILVPTIIAIATLVVMTVGATYAFFTVGQTENFGTSTATATTGEIGGVALTKADDADLTLDVTATQMLEEHVGATYYASGSATPKTIGTVAVTGAGTYNCTYTIEVTKTATNDLYTNYQGLATKATGEVYFTLNEQTYDFSTENLITDNTITYNGTVNNITEGNDVEITSNIVIANTNNDQTGINGSDITLTYDVTVFKCDLIED